MVEIPVFGFLLILQVIIVFAALAGYWFYRARELARRPRPAAVPAPTVAAAKPAAATGGPDLITYLGAEVQRCQARLDGLKAQEPNAKAYTWLSLRIELLRLEQDLAARKEHDDAYWLQVRERLQTMLAAHAPALAASAAVAQGATAEEDKVNVEQIIKDQDKTLEILLQRVVQDVIDPAKQKELVEHVEKLARANRELSFCVTTLDDENQFLRDQVRALLN